MIKKQQAPTEKQVAVYNNLMTLLKEARQSLSQQTKETTSPEASNNGNV